MKKAISTFVFLIIAQFSFSNSSICPDAPVNDDPCIESINPPFDLTGVGEHAGTTCCARGPQDTNPDGSAADFENVECNSSTEGAAVWYTYTPDPQDDGYSILLEPGDAEGPISVEVYTGMADAGCTGALTTFDFSCNSNSANINIGNCFDTDEVIFIKVTSSAADENCGSFTIVMFPAECEFAADNCIDLQGTTPFFPTTNEDFSITYFCYDGCLDYACPETDSNDGCMEFTEMPTVWFHVITDDLASQMFTTVEAEGNWEAIWSVYSGPDCDNLTIVNFGGSPPCSNGDNTPSLHQTSVFDDEQNYWIAVTIDPNSLPADGLDDGSFQICVATTANAIICLGELEGGACDDESLIMEVTARDNEDLPLEGPFCPGEEVEVNISFYYDASESGADWFIGMVPKFGPGWDMENFNYYNSPPVANGQDGIWYEEGSELAPIIQENVPILCTYRDEDGILQICNQLCSPCFECEQQGMLEGDPLPSGYFWVSNGGNAGCANDGSPGEGWGIGSVNAQVEWSFSLKVKEFVDLGDCMDQDDLFIGFQTFSDGVAGCWEDPTGECILDRMQFGPAWEIGCTEIPAMVVANDLEICTNQVAEIPVGMVDGSTNTIVVKALDNLYITGANDYEIENGSGTFTDVLVNNSENDQIQQYEVFAVDPSLECNGPKTVINVLVRSQYLNQLEDAVCACLGGCANIGVPSQEGSTYVWSTGDSTNMIDVCPIMPTAYTLTVTNSFGCEEIGTVLVDCEGMDDACIEPEYYKLITDFFIDNNEDGIRDSFDLPFSQGSFFLEPELILYYNTTATEDILLLEEGDYTLTFIQGNLNNHSLTTDSIVNVSLDSTQNCVKVEFGLSPDVSLIRKVNIYQNLFHRCNSDRTFQVFARNYGTTTESGILWATLDEIILPEDFPALANIDTFIAPNTMGWFFEDLYPGNILNKSVDVHIPGPPDYPAGWVVHHNINLELNNIDGSTQIWRDKDFSRSILCGYDPNDKAVEPAHEEGYTDIEEDELVFKIRFQNTGNAPTENIEIRDTLSEFLDVRSVQYIAGSHDEYLTFSRLEDRILVFNFDNINLPDSTTDLAGSQGFLIYSVSINEEVEEGTLIENTAHIYFDNNPAVVTNTTKNILYPDLDNDGYFSIEDCDEEDVNINPGAEEIPNNDVDEDCDGEALIIDNDMDGFNSDEDCDDENAEINPDAEEIINNNVDENCDDLVVVIDSDDDGFNSDDDCNDDNPDINPDAEDIPGNGIDEDCDGMDAVIIGVDEEQFYGISIHPNPSNDAFNIILNSTEEMDFVIRDMVGRVVMSGNISEADSTIYLGDEPNGIYLIALYDSNRRKSSFHKLLKI